MRVLVTGGRGQVASSLAELATGQPDVELIVAARPKFDLARPESIRAAILDARPEIVVSAAAFTSVERAEFEPELAYLLNATGAHLVAKAAAECGAAVIHLSTDYVFSGHKTGAYLETDEPGPLNAYGRSKLAGEQLVSAATPRHAILRSGWVYGPFGRNFVKTMLDRAREAKEIDVVCDQWGNPTSSLDLARGILTVARNISEPDVRPDRYGVFHLCGPCAVSWSELARQALARSRALGGPWARIRDIPSARYRSRALRPANSRLAATKLAALHGWSAPDTAVSLGIVVERLLRPAAPDS